MEKYFDNVIKNFAKSIVNRHDIIELGANDDDSLSSLTNEMTNALVDYYIAKAKNNNMVTAIEVDCTGLDSLDGLLMAFTDKALEENLESIKFIVIKNIEELYKKAHTMYTFNSAINKTIEFFYNSTKIDKSKIKIVFTYNNLQILDYYDVNNTYDDFNFIATNSSVYEFKALVIDKKLHMFT